MVQYCIRAHGGTAWFSLAAPVECSDRLLVTSVRVGRVFKWVTPEGQWDYRCGGGLQLVGLQAERRCRRYLLPYLFSGLASSRDGIVPFLG